MSDIMLDMAFRYFGFNDAQIARITAAIPKAAYLANLVRQHKTVINELIEVADMVAAQVAKKENPQ